LQSEKEKLMKVELRYAGLASDPSLGARVQRRLGLALERFRDRVQWARVQLRDVNGPRGGHDKLCVVQVRVKGGSDIILQERQADARSALDLAAGRVLHALARQLARQRQGTRRGALELLPA
jgi:putative sigma-54 modulation protein